MLISHNDYYRQMLKKNRLLPIMSNGRVSALLTFYIADDDAQFINADPYEVLEDNPLGKVCYVAQVVSIGNISNPLKIWSRFRKYITDNFKSVEFIHWNRGKNGAMYSYVKQINKEKEDDEVKN